MTMAFTGKFSFQLIKSIRSFGDSTLDGKITLGEVDKKTKQPIRKYFRI